MPDYNPETLFTPTVMSDRSWNDYGISFGDVKRMMDIAKDHPSLNEALQSLKIIHVLVDENRKPDDECYPRSLLP